MDNPFPSVLLAAPSYIARYVAPALEGDAEVLAGNTLVETLRILKTATPDVLVLSYVFDELRPFRLLAEVESASPEGHLPIVLLKATSVRLGETTEQLRLAYRSLGAMDFFNLWEERMRSGNDVALERLRRAVRRYLPKRRRA